MPLHRRGARRGPHVPGAADQTPDTELGAAPGDATTVDSDGSSADSNGKLRRSAIDGVKWNFLATAASLVGRLVFTFALARLIGPENFGIVALATLYIMFAVVVLDQGFGVALIQRKELGPGDIGSVAWLNLVTGTALMIATMFAAPYAAEFFDTPELTAVLRVLSVTLFIRGLTLARESLVRRSLRFRQFALIQTAAVIGGGTAGIVAAAMGAEYWALVVQAIVNDVIILAALLVMFRRVSWRASWSSIRSMAGFSNKILASKLLVYASQNADNILIGRALDPTQLAFYALAYRLLRLPIQMIGSVVNGVALPIFARLQHDDARTGAWFLLATQAMAIVTFPMFGIMFVGAEAGVEVAFGPDWSGAVEPLQAMAIAGIPMVVRMLAGPLATARARAGIVLLWTVITVGLQVVGFFVGLELGGMVGVAMSIVVVQYLTWLPSVWHILRTTVGVGLPAYVATLVPPVLGTVLAGTAWWAAYLPLQPGPGRPHNAYAVVGVTVLALALYGLAIRFVWPATFRSLRSIAGEMAERRTAG